MKPFIAITVLSVLLISCTEDTPVVNEVRMLRNVEVSYDELCDNELMLLSFPTNNWLIEQNAFATVQEYRDEQNARVDAYFASSEAEKYAVEKHPRVFPYVPINGVDVSLMRVLKNHRGGYAMHKEELTWVHGHHLKDFENSGIKDMLYRFYDSYKHSRPIKDYDPLAIRGPVVNITLANNEITALTPLVEGIAEVYIVAMNKRAVREFNRELCDLSEGEMLKLMKACPFKVRLFKKKG